jgi:hypothetical protein
MAEVIQTNIGKNVSDLSKSPQPKPYSKVVLIVDENTTYTAGSDSGLALEVECPWGTQAVANALLRQINGWVYRPYEASGALLNPAIEIGDGVVIDDNELDIWKRNVDFGALTTAELSAPTDEEVDHEYPWVSEQQRQTERKFVVVNDTIQANYSEFKTTASEISASVTAVETNKLDHTSATQTMSWSLTSDGFYINNSDTADDNHFKFKVDADGAEVNGTIRATAGEIGSFYIGSSDLHTRLRSGNEYVERTNHSSGTRGIKIDSNGISMGDGTEQTFYVTNSGYLTARHGTFGSLTVNNEGKTSGGYYGGLNGCTGSVSDLGGSISSDMGIGFGMTIGNLVSTADQAYTTSAQVLRDLGNYMAGSITANAFKATTINCSNLYLGNRALYTNGIYAAVPGTYSGTCRIVVDGQTRLGSCSITISGANYAAVNFQQ